MQDATEECNYPQLVAELLTMELNLTHPLEPVAELIVLWERMSSVAVDKFGNIRKDFKMDNKSLQQIIKRIPQLMYWHLCSIFFDYVPILSHETFATINIQPSNMLSFLRNYL